MSRILLSSVAAGAVLASAHGAAAQTEIQWWHAMGGALGEAVNELADELQQAPDRVQGRCRSTRAPIPRPLTAAIAAFRARQRAAHRAGVRGRHRHHDGRQGRGQSGLPADGGRQGAVRSQGLSSARSTATTRRPTASCCRCRSTARPRCSTGTRTRSRRRASIPNKPPTDLAGGGRRRPRRLVAAGAKCGFTPQWQSWTQIENFGAWHNLPYRHQGQRLRRHSTPS